MLKIQKMHGSSPKYYMNPCFAMERYAGKAEFKHKFYFQYEREDSWTRPGVRAFLVV
jgi:hypothetical protein